MAGNNARQIIVHCEGDVACIYVGNTDGKFLLGTLH
jgi:hypothetical protein